MNGNTRLSNLTVMVNPTSVHGSTASANLTMKNLCKLEELVETFFRTNTITTGNHDRRTFQVVLGSFYVVVEHFHDESFSRYIFRNFRINHLFLAFTLINSLLHHTTTHGSHLWTMVGIHDSSHDVSTEGRTNLIEQVLVNLIVLFVLIRTNLQFRAISCKTTGQ